MMKIFIPLMVLLIHINAHAYPLRQLDGTVEKVIDRTIIIDNEKFRPSGYASTLPKWISEGTLVNMSYACDELGDCYYIDIVAPGEPLPIMDKINKELLSFERVFP